MGRIPDSLSPCGVYCGACPSFRKSCYGCGSEDRSQKRKSKWSCKIRNCCFKEKNYQFCYQCNDFPCKMIDSKLIKSHPNEKKYTYRHEIVSNLKQLERVGIKQWLRELDKKWTCPECGGRLLWYQYKCSDCGYQLSET